MIFPTLTSMILSSRERERERERELTPRGPPAVGQTSPCARRNARRPSYVRSACWRHALVPGRDRNRAEDSGWRPRTTADIPPPPASPPRRQPPSTRHRPISVPTCPPRTSPSELHATTLPCSDYKSRIENSHVNKTKFLRPRKKQDQNNKTKTKAKTTRSINKGTWRI